MQNEIDFSEEFQKDAASRRRNAGKATQGLVAHPRSIDDVIKVITNPKHFRSPVRPVGSNSAANRANRAHGGTTLDMTQMNRVLQITWIQLPSRQARDLVRLPQPLPPRVKNS